MNCLVKVCYTAFFLAITFSVKAQVQVSFPTTRAVLQRDNSNQATIRITGYYTSALSRVEARLQARNGQGTSSDWQTIQNNPAGGVFAGDLTGKGGWYNLEVRGINGDQQVGNVTVVERVGIGEVFIIAGQSNAQGIHYNTPNPLNDRVNCVNYLYDNTKNNTYPTDPPTPVFTILDNFDGFNIAPRGYSSWCWGQLGDILVNRLNVPVMFFNAAFAGTAVRNWRESAPNGGTAISLYNGDPYPTGQPYANLKVSLQFYTNMLGVRAVLWHQGEADNLVGTSMSSYASDLTTIINKSRQDYNHNIPWVVARASYGDNINGGASNPAIVGAQNQVINTAGLNVFAGPYTDNIQIPRNRPPLGALLEGLHFDYNGLIDVANAWNASLTDSFFQSTTPVGPAASPTLSVACTGSNNLQLTVNGNYASVQWESGETGNTITKGAGTYRAKVKDGLGNTFFTGQIRVSDAPTISTADNRPASICIGSSLALNTNYNTVSWINQQTNATVANTQTFNTTTAGTYFVRYRDVSGCDFTSNTLSVAVNPLPDTPTVVADKPTTFCQGDNTSLRASSDNVQYNWSDGQKNKAVNIGSSGSYYLTVTDKNGCTSAQSNAIVVTANPTPAKPVISASGPIVFCADRTITLTAPQNVSYQWSSGQTTQSITLSQSGSYAVRTQNQYGCTSVQSDATNITVNSLPQAPTIAANGTTTFCDGGQVTLNASSPYTIIWSSGQTAKSITVKQSGNYTVQAIDQNGCYSTYSASTAVKVNPLPATPIILADPSPAICEGSKATLRIDTPYTVFWSTGDSTQRISTGTAGVYTAKVRDANGCISAQAGTVTVELKPLPPAPTINVVGTYTLEAVSSTNGTQFRWYRNNDSLAVNTAMIKANQSGTYTARASIIYSSALTCFSLPSAPVSFTIDPNNRGLSLYPNPNPDKIVTLETQDNLVNAVVTVYTLTGQAILTTTVSLFDAPKQLTLTGTPTGSYIIRVQATNFDVSKRILLGL